MELNDPGGSTRIERRLGFTSIAVQPTSEAVVARVRSFGFLDAPLGFTAGYAKHEVAVLGDDCRAVFWVESQQHLEALERLTADLKNVCLINPREGDLR